ncbi:sphinganine C4-monooxygenase 1-like [Hordeum vulgare]|nr:sphinganine C4-monooxygenase 1-like [Hordeum vulgare]
MAALRFSDEVVAAVVPILVYWTYSDVHTTLGHGRVMAKYRLNTKAEEDSKNTVSKRAVLGNVLMQLVAVTVLTLITKTSQGPADSLRPRFVKGDWGGFERKFLGGPETPQILGRPFGHPVEALIADTADASLAILASDMSSSPRATAVFLSLCNIKGIDNHCGLCLLPRRV